MANKMLFKRLDCYKKIFVVVLARSSPFLAVLRTVPSSCQRDRENIGLPVFFSFFRLLNSVSEPDSLCPDPDPAFYF
jgi:hypothetical protein